MTTTADRIRAELNGLDHGDSPAMPIAAVRAVLDLCDRIRRGLDGISDPEAMPLVAAAGWFEQAVATAMGIKEET